jgi:hypothetical protein
MPTIAADGILNTHALAMVLNQSRVLEVGQVTRNQGLR